MKNKKFTFLTDKSSYLGTQFMYSFFGVLLLCNFLFPSVVFSQFVQLDNYRVGNSAQGRLAITEINGNRYLFVSEYEHDRVRIMDISDPTAMSHITTISDGASFPGLDRAHGLSVIEISGTPYLLVASYHEEALQIVDVSDPANPSSIAVLRDGTNGFILEGALEVNTRVISGKTYAFVSNYKEGVEIIDITDPTNASPVSRVAMGSPKNVEFVEANSKLYMIVPDTGATNQDTDAIRVFDITDLSSPTQVISFTSDSGYTINYLNHIKIVEIGGSIYGLSSQDVYGFQIINFTDPENPSWVSGLFPGGVNNNSIDPQVSKVIMFQNKTYALVSCLIHDSVQMIDISDPNNPSVDYTLVTSDVNTYFDGIYDISVFENNGMYYSAISAVFGNSVFLLAYYQSAEFTSANSFSVAEDTAVNSIVFTVTATDPDPGDVISYSLTDNTNTFSIDSSTGVITLVQSLDYETTASYSIEVNALVANEPTVSQTITVTVTNAAEGFSYDADANMVTALSSENITSFADFEDVTYVDYFSYASTDGDDSSVISEYRAIGNQGNLFQVDGTLTINAKTDLLVMDDYVGAESNIDSSGDGYMKVTGRLNLHDFQTASDGTEIYNYRTSLKILQQQQNSWGSTGSANNMVVNDGVLNIKGATLETDGRIMVTGSDAAFQLDNGKIIWQQPYSGSVGGVWFRQENPTTQSNGGSYIRNGTIVGGSLQTFGGGIEIEGVKFIDAPFGFQFGSATPAVFEIRSYTSEGNEADIPFWSNGETNGRQINMINTDLGTDLKVKGQQPSNGSNYGTIILFQEFKIMTKDLNGNPIEGASFLIQSTDNNTRKTDNRSDAASYDFNEDFVNTGTTDSNGEYEGLYDQTAADNNALVVGEFVKVSSDSAAQGTVNTGENQPRRRGKNDSDVFDVHYFAYGYLPTTQEIAFRNLEMLEINSILLADSDISQNNKSTVDAYNEIDNLDKFYDRGMSWKVDNMALAYPSAGENLFAISGTSLDLGDQNLVVDASATNAFAVDTSTNTITIKASTLSAGSKFNSLITTGSISTQNNSEVNFGYEDSSGKTIFVDFDWGTNDEYDVKIINLNDNNQIGSAYNDQIGSFKGTFTAPNPLGSGVQVQLLNTSDNSITFYTANFTDTSALTFTKTSNDITTVATGDVQRELLFLVRKILQKTESAASALGGTTPTLDNDNSATTTGTGVTTENLEAIEKVLLEILKNNAAIERALERQD